MAPKPRNPELIRGVTTFGRSAMFSKRRLYKKKAHAKVEKKAETFKVKKVGGEKNGGERKVPLKKARRFHEAEPTPVHHKKAEKATTAKLRANITPGTVLILLAGRFRGRRVVFLKQLKSGLLLVNGPFKINGVPLRRVNQAYVISTSTKVDISSVKINEKLDDTYFRRTQSKKVKDEKEFFNQVKQVSLAPLCVDLWFLFVLGSDFSLFLPPFRKPPLTSPGLPTKRRLTRPSLRLSRRPPT